MYILSSPLRLLCQLAALAASVSAVMDSGISEIDLIIPTPNTTYEAGKHGRFAFVWAVRNPSLWRGQSVTLTFNVQDYPTGYSTAIEREVDLISSDDGTRYIVAAEALKPEGTFYIAWKVSGDVCGNPKGFNNGTGSADDLTGIPATDGVGVVFSTKPGGQKADFSLAANADCSSRTAVAYNIAIAKDKKGCRAFDDDDPFPSPAPCDLKVSDSDVANVTKSLNAQYDKRCFDHPLADGCPLPSSSPSPTDKKNSAPQTQLGSAAMGLALSLPLAALFL